MDWFAEKVKVQKGWKLPRWKALGTIPQEPEHDLTVPVRHLRVMYALPNKLYAKWCPHRVPTGYEFFCAHSSLSSGTAQSMRKFLGQMSVAAQFYTRP
jgi:hypothetical protein